MQNPKRVRKGGCHIKAGREFRDTASCLAFNLPWLHLSVKLLFSILTYLREKKGQSKKEVRCYCTSILIDMQCTQSLLLTIMIKIIII